MTTSRQLHREIKFRAWTGKHFEYDFNMYSNGDAIDVDTPYYEPNKRLNWVLSQYTGLKDVNGTEIYEGDVVRSYHFELDEQIYYLHHAIEWSEAYHSWFALNCASRDPNDGSVQLFVLAKQDLEIIGNIYETPELLEAKSNGNNT